MSSSHLHCNEDEHSDEVADGGEYDDQVCQPFLAQQFSGPSQAPIQYDAVPWQSHIPESQVPNENEGDTGQWSSVHTATLSPLLEQYFDSNGQLVDFQTTSTGAMSGQELKICIPAVVKRFVREGDSPGGVGFAIRESLSMDTAGPGAGERRWIWAATIPTAVEGHRFHRGITIWLPSRHVAPLSRDARAFPGRLLAKLEKEVRRLGGQADQVLLQEIAVSESPQLPTRPLGGITALLLFRTAKINFATPPHHWADGQEGHIVATTNLPSGAMSQNPSHLCYSRPQQETQARNCLPSLRSPRVDGFALRFPCHAVEDTDAGRLHTFQALASLGRLSEPQSDFCKRYLTRHDGVVYDLDDMEGRKLSMSCRSSHIGRDLPCFPLALRHDRVTSQGTHRVYSPLRCPPVSLNSRWYPIEIKTIFLDILKDTSRGPYTIMLHSIREFPTHPLEDENGEGTGTQPVVLRFFEFPALPTPNELPPPAP